MILFLLTLHQDIDFNDLYNKATTSLVQFHTEQESAFALFIDLGKDTLCADTTIAFLVSKFDTKGGREQHRMKDIFKEIGEYAIDGIVDKIAYRGSDQAARSLKQSLWILGEIGSDRIIEPVARFIDDQQWSVRSSAYTALGKTKSRKALCFIIKGLNDPIEIVRKSAYFALGQIATSDELDFLLDGLGDDFYGVRHAAMQGLINIGPEIFPVLIDQVGKNDMRDYYLLKILCEFETPERDVLIEQSLDFKPTERRLFYEIIEDDAILRKLVDQESNLFLRNYLLEKIKK